jgi:heme-degrading monooxygenase HmoA
MTRQPAPNHTELTVLFEFDLEAEEQEPLQQVLAGLVPEVLGQQPGLLSARVLKSRDGRKMLAHLLWQSLEAFENFRHDDHTQRRITTVLGPYGPELRVYDTVLTAGRDPSTFRPAPSR